MSHSKSITGIRMALLGAVVLGCAIPPQRVLAAVSPLPRAQSDAAGSTAEVRQLLARAQKAVADGNLRLALINLKTAVQIAPADGVARTQLGIVFLRAGYLGEAERELRHARRDGAPPTLVLPPLFQVMFSRNESQMILAQFPDPGVGSKEPAAADILTARALALARLKRMPEAMDAMDRSLEARRDAPGLLNKARLLLQTEDRGRANRLVDEAMERFPASTDVLIFKAELLLASGDKTGVQALADRLGTESPKNVSSQLGRIEIFLSLKQDEKAGAEIEKLLAKNPRLPMGMYYQALLLARKGDIKGAWIITQSMPQGILDDYPNTAAIVAQIAENAGKIDVAATILTGILVRSPDMTSVRMHLAALRLKQDSPGAALRVLEPIKNSRNPVVIELLARAHYESDRVNNSVSSLPSLEKAGQNLQPQQLKDYAGQDIKDLASAATKEPTNAAFVVPYITALVDRQRYSEALTAADRLGAGPNQRVSALVYRGNILLLQNDAAGAQTAFDKAIQIEPANQMALRARASSLLAAQKNSEAGRDFQALLARDPKDMTALLGLAEIAARQGRNKDVQQILSKAIDLWPQSEPPRIALIRNLMTRQELTSSLKLADELARLHPQSAEGAELQGQIHSLLGQKKEAVVSFRRLVALLPNAAEPQAQLARALFAAGDRGGASRAINAAVKLKPGNAKLVSDQISLQLTLGSNNAAVAAAQSFRKLRPGLEADFLLADTFVKTGRPEQASKLLAKRFSEHPNSVVLQRLMQIPMQPPEDQRTRQLAAKWLGTYPGDTLVHLEYAGLLMQAGENSKAIAQYEMVLKQDPQNFAAMNNLAWLIQDSDPKRAVTMLTLAADLSHDAPEIIDTLGWVKLQQKDVAGGLKLLQKAHALQPQNGEVTYHLAVALDANSDRNSARKLLKTLLTSGIRFQDHAAAEKLSSAWR